MRRAPGPGAVAAPVKARVGDLTHEGHGIARVDGEQVACAEILCAAARD